jgi:hypothetical protein
MGNPSSLTLNKYMNLLVFVPLMLVCQFVISNEIKVRTFQILNSYDSIPVPFVHVINYTTGNVVTSNYDGIAKISASSGDTLLFSCIGYYFFKKELVYGSDLSDTIFLMRRTQDLDPIVIIPYKTYEEFKTAFINLKLPETRLDILKRNLRSESIVAIKKAHDEGCGDSIQNPDGTFGGGATMTLDFPTKEDIQRRKLALIAPVEKEQQYIDQKFNHSLVKDITGLQEPELSDFILYCDFTHEFLYYSSEYTIVMAIKTNLSEYLKKHTK